MLGDQLALAAKGLLGSDAVHQSLIKLLESVIPLSLHLEVLDQLILLLLVQPNHSVYALTLIELVIVTEFVLRWLWAHNLLQHRHVCLLNRQLRVYWLFILLLLLIEVELSQILTKLAELVVKKAIKGQAAGRLAAFATTDFVHVTLAGLHIGLWCLCLLLLEDPLTFLLFNDQAAFDWRHISEARASSQRMWRGLRWALDAIAASLAGRFGSGNVYALRGVLNGALAGQPLDTSGRNG